MQPRGSVPCSKGTTTAPDPEPDASSLHPLLRSILTLPFHIRLGLQKWSLPFRFSKQNIKFMSHLSYPCYIYRPSHPPLSPNNIWWCVQVIKLLIMQSSPAFHHVLPLRSKYYPQHPVLKHLSSLSVRETKFHTHTKQQIKNYCFVYFNFKFLWRRKEDRL